MGVGVLHIIIMVLGYILLYILQNYKLFFFNHMQSGYSGDKQVVSLMADKCTMVVSL